MLIDAGAFVARAKDEIQSIVNKMITGCKDWEEYRALQARASVLVQVIEDIEITVKNQTDATQGEGA